MINLYKLQFKLNILIKKKLIKINRCIEVHAEMLIVINFTVISYSIKKIKQNRA